jgi:hypothetical protein
MADNLPKLPDDLDPSKPYRYDAEADVWEEIIEPEISLLPEPKPLRETVRIEKTGKLLPIEEHREKQRKAALPLSDRVTEWASENRWATPWGRTEMVAELPKKAREAWEGLIGPFREREEESERIKNKVYEQGFDSLNVDEYRFIRDNYGKKQLNSLAASDYARKNNIPEEAAIYAATGKRRLQPIVPPLLGPSGKEGLIAGQIQSALEKEPVYDLMYSPEVLEQMRGSERISVLERESHNRFETEVEAQEKAAFDRGAWTIVHLTNAFNEAAARKPGDKVGEIEVERPLSRAFDSLSMEARYGVLDGNGSLHLNKLEDKLMPQYITEATKEVFGEEHLPTEVFEPGKPGFGRMDEVLDIATKRWQHDKALILSADKGGIPIVDLDPDQTNKWIYDTHKKVKTYAGPFMPVAASTLVMPVLAAMAPRRALTGSHEPAKMWATRSMWDSLTSWAGTTWLGSAIRTYEDSVLGRGLEAEGVEESEILGVKFSPEDFINAVTYSDIEKYSGFPHLADWAQAAGGEDGEGAGLARLLSANVLEYIDWRTADSVRQAKGALGAAKMLADVATIFAGETGDSLKTYRMIQHLRNGEMLMMTYDHLGELLATELELDPGAEHALRATMQIAGFASELTPILGADVVTGALHLGIQGTRRITGLKTVRLKHAKRLRELADNHDLSSSQLLDEIDKFDQRLGKMLRMERRAEGDIRAPLRAHLRHIESGLDEALERAHDDARTAGVEASPPILPGRKLLDPYHREEWIENRAQDILGKEQAIKRTGEPHLRNEEWFRSNAARERAMERATKEYDDGVDSLGNQISETTVAGDVYRADVGNGETRLFMRLGSGEDGVWVPVELEDIQAARSIVTTDAFTTVSPLLDFKRKRRLVPDTLVKRQAAGEGKAARPPDEHYETPWAEKAQTRIDIEEELRASNQNLIPVEDQIRYLRENKLDIPPHIVERSEGLLGHIRALEDRLAIAKTEEATARKTFWSQTKYVPAGVDDVSRILGDPGLWRTSQEMVGARAVDIRRTVVSPQDLSPQARKALEEQSDALLREYHSAYAELQALKREFRAWKGKKTTNYEEGGASYGEEVSYRERIERLERDNNKLKKRWQKVFVSNEKSFKKHQKLFTEETRARSRFDRATKEVDDAIRAGADRKEISRLQDRRDAFERAWEHAAADTQRNFIPYAKAMKELDEIASGISLNSMALTEARILRGEINPKVLERATSERSGWERMIKRAEQRVGDLKTEYTRRSPNPDVEAIGEPVVQVEKMVESNMEAFWKQYDLDSVRRIARGISERIELGLKTEPPLRDPQEKFEDILNMSTISRDPDGSRLINTINFNTAITNKFGREAFDRALEHGGEGIVLANRIVEAGQKGRVRVRLTLNQVEKLQQQLPVSLSWAKKETGKVGQALTTVKALERAAWDPDLRWGLRGAWYDPRSYPLAEWFTGTARRLLKDWGDPVRYSLGEMSESLVQVEKMVEHSHDQLRDEMEAMARLLDKMARKQGLSQAETALSTERQLLWYLNARESIPIFKTRGSHFNTGSESIWEQFRNQCLADPRVQTYATLVHKAEARLAVMIKGGMKEADAPSVRKILEDEYGEQLRAVETEKGLPLRAVSRAYLPEGAQWGGMSQGQAAIAYNMAYNALKKNAHLQNFLKDLQSITSNTLGFGPSTNTAKALQMITYAMGHGAIQYRANRLMRRAIGGMFSPETANDLVRWMDHRPNSIKNPQNLLAALNRMGIPFTSRSVKVPIAGRRHVEMSLEPVITGKVGDQEIYMPKVLQHKIDAAMPRVTKDLAETYVKARTPETLLMAGAQWDAFSLWKTSVVTGLFVPRPKYFWNNFWGDFSQIMLGQGLGAAARTSGQLVHTVSLNTLEGMPGIGSFLKKRHAEMASRMGGEEKTLGSAWNALLNPVANQIWRGEKGVLRTTEGLDANFETLRKMFWEEGLGDVMVQEELLRSWHRVVPDDWRLLNYANEARHGISSFASYVQQRQRFNFFIDMIRRGHSPKNAARLTRNALYDWKNAVGYWEMNTIGKISPFYRFWKLGTKQMWREVTDPITRPGDATIKRIMSGQTGLKRAYNNYALMHQYHDIIDPVNHDGFSEDDAHWNHTARYLRPGWAANRATLMLRRNDFDRMNHYQRIRGRVYSHNALMGPPSTSLDIGEMYGSILGAVASSVKSIADDNWDLPIADNWRATPGAWVPTAGHAGSMLYPHMWEPIESVVDQLGFETGGFGTLNSSGVRISPGTAAAMKFIGQPVWGSEEYMDPGAIGAILGAAYGYKTGRGTQLMKGGSALKYGIMGGVAAEALLGDPNIRPHKEHGYMVADPLPAFMFSLIPGLGTGLPVLLDAAYYDNPEMQAAVREYQNTGLSGSLPLWLKGSMEFASQVTFGKKQPIDPKVSHGYLKKGTIRRAEEILRQQKEKEKQDRENRNKIFEDPHKVYK